MQGGTWRFWGLIKRTADKLVSHGNDIADANVFYLALEKADIAVDLLMITDDSNLDTDKMSSIPLKAIPGTMMIHQVISHR